MSRGSEILGHPWGEIIFAGVAPTWNHLKTARKLQTSACIKIVQVQKLDDPFLSSPRPQELSIHCMGYFKDLVSSVSLILRSWNWEAWSAAQVAAFRADVKYAVLLLDRRVAEAIIRLLSSGHFGCGSIWLNMTRYDKIWQDLGTLWGLYGNLNEGALCQDDATSWTGSQHFAEWDAKCRNGGQSGTHAVSWTSWTVHIVHFILNDIQWHSTLTYINIH